MKRVTTRTLLTCAAIGVAFGVIGIGDSALMAAVALAAPPFYPVLSGVYLMPGIIAVSLLRRPGVAILTRVLAGLVSVGATSAIMAPGLAFILFGVVLEVAHLATRYRNWSAWPVYIAAALVGLLGAVSSFALLGGSTLPVAVMILAPITIVGATLLWALLARTIAAALRRTGVGAPPAHPQQTATVTADAD
ncbi:ECF transporter S component [Microbacterium invictum]|uniref:Energy-coupling factor transport system substrate-specific component n=1 Tax=Microbacterium invictum TaxID=515415 RepID=A0AA40VNE9_9MICO|nr:MULTISPECIES: ECF transporter S component [Microbacterium]MBB4140358.1 energy-coupling factor transport system substrate-specific component [Microbacterium invictum]